MKIIRRKSDLQALTGNWRRAGETIGVVLTMGALHDGHLSLVKAAHSRADRVIVTIFVNPRQFNNPEDLAKYPKTEESDARILGPLDVDVLYVPEPEEIYPTGFSTTISVSGVSDGLCGGDRPGHFDGVATVVTKLLLQTDADCTFFGEKDYQQLQVVRRVVADLDLKTEIVACPTVREDDGLAMSSRNLRLGSEARQMAPVIGRVLKSAANVIRQGGNVALALETARQALLVAGFDAVDYFELRSDSDLLTLTTADQPARLFVAAWLNGVRLIDNMPVATERSAQKVAAKLVEPV
ncbi:MULTISPECIES: pantoate--beta-alanine ligase [Roseobacteraceae]|uniref:Pantothenate synthetase n=1 Tax=Pseudosulfitobacter pseudonitzschiae TaxID=1402135 RepID=A0A221K8I6_9RHOB|nr:MULTISPECIES: pantoate--beta-alanine ligase [Roseobacteraceae]ASM75167.1 pantothenate synthetase [Pseudosulfitobacter pseudonitzschiae]